MPVRFYKKPVIAAGSVAFLAILIIALFFFFIYKNHTSQREQYKTEKKQLREIFTMLDTSYWKSKTKSLSLSNEAVRISRKINDSNALTRALFNKARIFRENEQIDSILPTYKLALKIAKLSHNDTSVARIKNGIGNYYLDKDDYYLAMSNYMDAHRIFQRLNMKKYLSFTSNGLGLIYLSLNDFDSAILYFAKANIINHELGNLRDEAGINLNIGSCYIEKGNYAKADSYIHKALITFDNLKDTLQICNSYVYFGTIYQKFGKTSIAFDYFNKALSLVRCTNNQRMLGAVLNNIGTIYDGNNEIDLAQKYYRQSLTIFEKIDYKSAEMETLLSLSEIERRKNNWKLAHEYFLKYIGLKDRVANGETNKKIAELQWKYDSQRKEYETKLLQKKYELQKHQKHILTVTFILFFIVMLVIGSLIRLTYIKSEKIKELENKHLQEQVKTEEKINLLERYRHQEEMDAKNKELTRTSLQLITKNETLTGISEFIDKLNHDKIIEASTYNEITRALKNDLSYEKDWKHFKALFDKVHHNFFINIKQICPALTESELRLCAYLRINLQNKEIAKMLNIGSGSVKTCRYRIRTKLNLDNATSLEDYIRNI